MDEIYFMRESIYDMALINHLKDNEQYIQVINNNLEYDKANCCDIKKLIFFLHPGRALKIKYNNNLEIPVIDDDLLEFLKVRKEIYDKQGVFVINKILSFYTDVIYISHNKRKDLKLSFKSLSDYIILLKTISNNDYDRLKDMYLIPKIIDDICKSKIKDLNIIKHLIREDIKLIAYISEEFNQYDELINYMLDNNLIDVDYIFNNCNDTMKMDIDFICMMILNSPRAFRYFNHNLIDFAMIKKLVYNFYPNNEYRNFCSDPRFYKFFYKLEDDEIKKSEYVGKYDNKIVEIISKYIPLHKLKLGNDYLGLCPFHDDHNPSLRVSPKKGVWKCFSCGEGGNAVYFVRKYTSGGDSSLMQKSIYLYSKNMKNQFLYYLYSNLPNSLKHNKEIAKYFLSMDGCLIKLFPKELKYDSELTDIAIDNDITSFRYIMGNIDLKNKYLKKNVLLEYYSPNYEKSNKYREIANKYIHIPISDIADEIFGNDPFGELNAKLEAGEIGMEDIKIEIIVK